MFVATHVEGPMASCDVSMAAPRTPERIFYAPVPKGVAGPFGSSGYLVVDYDRAPDVPWPGQVEYRLDRESSQLEPHPQYGDEGMETGVAVYVLVEA